MKITTPTDRQTFEGEIATYWFDEGILVSLSKSRGVQLKASEAMWHREKLLRRNLA